MKAFCPMQPLPSSFLLVTSPQELVQLLKTSEKQTHTFHNTFESTLLYGVPLWAKAIQQQESASCVFALNINQYPGYFFAGLRRSIRFFVCHEDLRNKEKLREFAQKKGGDLYTTIIHPIGQKS